MLSKEFLKIAEETRRNWAPPSARPNDYWNKGYNHDKPVFNTTNTSSHCGTAELANVESEDVKQGGTVERIVANLAWRVVRDKIGNFVYYCPKNATYVKATKKLEKLGFEKVREFHHLGKLNRKSDKGIAELWCLSVTPPEALELKKIGAVKVDPILQKNWPSWPIISSAEDDD